MSSCQGVAFAEDSDLPAVRAAADVLLLIGRALRLHFPGFLDTCEGNAPPHWDEVLQVLADVLFREMRAKHITDITHALDVWKEFAATLTVQRLSAPVSKTVQDIGAMIAADAIPGNAGLGMDILDAASLHAEKWIRQRILPRVQNGEIQSAAIVIDFDEQGTRFCASSSSTDGLIHWTLQPFEHSLYGAMALSRVMEHEYVCHLLPVNQYLSKGVREVFLVETLEEEHRNDAAQNSRVRDAEIKLAGWCRFLVEQHFSRNRQMSRAALRDFEEIAIRLRRRSIPNFWKIAGEILTTPDNREQAVIVDRVLTKLRYLPDPMVDRLSLPWRGFAACLEGIMTL